MRYPRTGTGEVRPPARKLTGRSRNALLTGVSARAAIYRPRRIIRSGTGHLPQRGHTSQPRQDAVTAKHIQIQPGGRVRGVTPRAGRTGAVTAQPGAVLLPAGVTLRAGAVHRPGAIPRAGAVRQAGAVAILPAAGAVPPAGAAVVQGAREGIIKSGRSIKIIHEKLRSGWNELFSIHFFYKKGI